MLGQSASSDTDFKERLIANVKKEVKQIMEESVTRKFVHEDSSTVISLCGAVEACLSHGLRRRALGLFKTSSTTALLHKISSNCDEAAYVSKRIHEIEAADPSKRSSSSSDSIIKTPLLTKKSSSNSVSGISTSLQNSTTNNTISSPVVKYLWIRIALYERKLSKIIDHLVSNAHRYYDKDSLVADSDYGSILSSLLVGPCALEYSKAKSQDCFWNDPTANDLVQRHIISTPNSQMTPTPSRRPMLNIKRTHNSSDDSGIGSYNKSNSPASTAKDYVESLHQNSRATLLYGKNNVHVHHKDSAEPMAGYLSLHQSIQSLTMKWTPNQLMNGYNDNQSLPSSAGSGSGDSVDKSFYWAYVLNINIEDIVYVHCHQNRSSEETSGTIILVGHDGVQRPPIHFPEGGHMSSFLSCLETGLLPHGQLDPPLWSQKGIGKIFSWAKSRRRIGGLPSVLENNDEVPIDYVFRVVGKSNTEDFLAASILDFGRTSPRFRPHLSSCSTNGSSDGSSKSISIDLAENSIIQQQTVQPANQSQSIALVCTTMKRQIISRAFYGWLAYCRHLSTVRTHLTGLVHGRITPDIGADCGLSEERWKDMHDDDGIVSDESEVYRLVYFGGVAPEIRKEVWPYLLGHHSFGQTPEEIREHDENTKHYYETTMSEWLAVEAIVRQLDKEKTANAIVKSKLSSGGSGSDSKIKNGIDVDGDIENEVFEENGFSDLSEPEIEEEEKTKTNDNEDEVPIDVEKQEKDEENVDDKKTEQQPAAIESLRTSSTSSYETVGTDFVECPMSPKTSVIVTDASVDLTNINLEKTSKQENVINEELETLHEELSPGQNSLQEPKSACVSPASSNGGIYSTELLEQFGLNLHRIEKDVQRCDRNYWYFANENLDKLRNVITTYVYEHLDIGYMQGMCDLLAPLLVIFDDESLSYGCFCKLMERMIENFPNGCAMDMHFANMRSLIQILDSEMYDLMHAHGDYTHFYFCYRWFLLDFKREFLYADVFSVWECIWAAKSVSSGHFVLFLALSLLETYRDIILSNSMDFTDIIKFFNEMAERHQSSTVLKTARNLVLQLQTLIENK